MIERNAAQLAAQQYGNMIKLTEKTITVFRGSLYQILNHLPSETFIRNHFKNLTPEAIEEDKKKQEAQKEVLEAQAAADKKEEDETEAK